MSYVNYNMDTNINGGLRNKILLAPGVRMDSLFTPTSDQQHAMGRILEADDGTGRMWRYCKNGSTALVQSFLVSSEAPSSNGLEVAQSGYDFADGDVKFNILLSTGHNYSDHELVDGWLYVNKSPTDGAVVGGQFLIKDNWIETDDTVMTIEIADQDGLRLSASLTSNNNELSIVKSPYRDVVVTPTTQAAIIVGVPNVAVTANYYFWAQYKGPATVIVDTGETMVIGEPCGYPATPNVAGAIGPIGADSDTYIGNTMTEGAAAEPSLVNLDIA